MASSKRYRPLRSQAKITPVVSSPSSFRYLRLHGRKLQQPLISGAIRNRINMNHFMIHYSQIFCKLLKIGLPFSAKRKKRSSRRFIA
jgi:hypothetical protein